MYAHVTDGVVDSHGSPPNYHNDGTRWWDLRDREPELLAEHGWYEVDTSAPRPDDTLTTTANPVFVFDGTGVTRTWEMVDKSLEQQAEEEALREREIIRASVKAIVTDLQAEKARLDPIIAKTNNQITGADTKDVARASKRIADAAIELARFVGDQQ